MPGTMAMNLLPSENCLDFGQQVFLSNPIDSFVVDFVMM